MKCFLKESLFALGNPDVTNHHSIMRGHVVLFRGGLKIGKKLRKSFTLWSHFPLILFPLFSINFIPLCAPFFNKFHPTVCPFFQKISSHCALVCACVVYYKNREFAIVLLCCSVMGTAETPQSTVDDHPFFYTKRVSHNPVQLASRTQAGTTRFSLLPIFSF